MADGLWLRVVAGLWLRVAGCLWLRVAGGLWLWLRVAGEWLVACGLWLRVACVVVGGWPVVASGGWL